MSGFAQEAWVAVGGRYADILDHPFVRGLADGSLPEEAFVRYLVDDAHYLGSYARTLATIAARMPTPAGVGLFAGFAAAAVEAERALHRGVLLLHGVDPDVPGSTGWRPESITCTAYTGYLARCAATAPTEVAVAAVLPCFRVYAEVGAHIMRTSPVDGDHPFAAWIHTYDDPQFADAVRAAEAAADAVAIGSPHRSAMQDAYVRATDYEWAFWDTAWKGEQP